MVDANLISMFFYSVAAIAVTIAATFYVIASLEEREKRKKSLRLRETELLWSIYKRWGEPNFLDAWNTVSSLEWTDYDDYMNRYGPGSNPDLEVKRGMIGIYFESVGILLKRNLIDVSAVDDMMSGYIIGYWRKYEPIMTEFRRRNNRPEVAEHIEYLYNEVQKVYREQHPEI